MQDPSPLNFSDKDRLDKVKNGLTTDQKFASKTNALRTGPSPATDLSSPPGHSRSGPTERYEYERKVSYISYWTKPRLILIGLPAIHTEPYQIDIRQGKYVTAQSQSDWLPVTLL